MKQFVSGLETHFYRTPPSQFFKSKALCGPHGPIEMAEVETERTYTKGVMKKIISNSGKVTIINEELGELDMPAVTMVFRVADDAMLEASSERQEITLVAKRVNGTLTVTAIRLDEENR